MANPSRPIRFFLSLDSSKTQSFTASSVTLLLEVTKNNGMKKYWRCGDTVGYENLTPTKKAPGVIQRP